MIAYLADRYAARWPGVGRPLLAAVRDVQEVRALVARPHRNLPQRRRLAELQEYLR